MERVFRWRLIPRFGKSKKEPLLEDIYHDQRVPKDPVEHADAWLNPFTPLDGEIGGPSIPLYEWFKIVVTGPIVLTVRVILSLPLLLLAMLIARIAVIGADISSPDNDAPPFTRWRNFLCSVIRVIARIVLFIYGFYYIRLDREPLNEGLTAPIMVSNHTSIFDAIIYLSLFNFSPVATFEAANTPVFGSVCKALQAILVNRFAKTSSDHVKNEILRRSAPNSGFPPVMIFPEGVCKDSTCLIRFRMGAFNPGKPIRPFVLRYPWRFFNPAWTQEGLRRQLRILCQYVNHAHIEELPIYFPDEEERRNPKLYADNVRDAMARHMNLPVTDHTVQDTVLMLDSLQLQVELGNAQYGELKKVCNKMDLEKSRELLKVFKSIDKSQSGTVGYEDFCRALKLDADDDMAEHIFDLMDMDGSGTLNYFEFVYGMHIILMECQTTDDYIDTSFTFYDTDNDGFISLEEVELAFSKLEGLYTAKNRTDEQISRNDSLHRLRTSRTEDQTSRRAILVGAFQALDNGTGRVDKAAFQKIFEKMREATPAHPMEAIC